MIDTERSIRRAVIGTIRETKTVPVCIDHATKGGALGAYVLLEEPAADQELPACVDCTVEAEQREHAAERKERKLKELGIVHHGTKRWSTDSEGGLMWWVFEDILSQTQVRERLTEAGIDWKGYPCCNGMYDCCGHYFLREVHIVWRGNHTLVKQTFGLDI